MLIEIVAIDTRTLQAHSLPGKPNVVDDIVFQVQLPQQGIVVECVAKKLAADITVRTGYPNRDCHR